MNDLNSHPNTFRPAMELRWCYYLHLDTASKCDDWHDPSGRMHPVFRVEGKKRVVFVRGYFDDHEYTRCTWCLVYQLTSTHRLRNGKCKPNLARIGSILDDHKVSYVQLISEKYPLSLIEQAESGKSICIDRMACEAIRKIVDHASYRAPSM